MALFDLFCRSHGSACRTARLAAALSLLLPLVSTARADAQRTSLAPLRQALPAGGSEAGDLPASQAVPSLTVQLKRTAAQQADLDAYLTAVKTAGSPEYHHWLTPAQFAARFAPAAVDVAPVKAWLATQGLQVDSVSAGGMRLSVSGTAAQAATAFGVRLQRYAVATGDLVKVDGTPTVPDALAASVQAVSGLDATATAIPDALTTLESAVDANTSVVVITDLAASKGAADELKSTLEQASAQGQTVVAMHVAADLLPARALVVVSPTATAADDSVNATPRPDWQVAPGLPADGLRAAPDASVADAQALVQALQTVVTKSGRMGDVAARFYAIAPEAGVFTHADSSVAAGSWATADGLGTVDLQALIKALAVGSTAPLSSQIVLSTRDLNHGQSITLTATITGGSGIPTGTVTFASAQDGTIASANLSAGTTAGTAVATYSTAALPGGLHGFYGTYNGDSTYAVSTTNVDTATVQPEAVTITGSVSGSPTVGTLMPVLITVKSPSGVGTPSGAVTVNPYGTALGQTAFTGTLATTVTGTATATVNIPATNAGSYTFQASCTTDASFSCAQPATFAVTEAKGTPAFTLVQTGTSAAATLTATAAIPAGAASTVVAPTGSVQFLDNGVSISSGTLDSTGKATYTGALGSGTTHLVTATYGGDGNYVTATATANATPTKVTPKVALSVVTAGSSLSAAVTPPSGTTTIPTGSVQFYLGTTSLGTGAVNSAGVATYTGSYTTGILTAVYGGDTNFLTATSNAIDTSKTTPTVTLVNTSTTSGTVALTATVMNGTAVATTATGTMSFLDGSTSLGSGTVTAGVATYSGALSATASVVRIAGPLATVSHTVTAVYSGDTSFNSATSNAVTANATTTLITTTTSLTSSSGYTGPFGTSFSLISVVTPASFIAAGTAPTGTITITDSVQGVVATGTLTSGTATIPVSTLTVGAHSLTATYSGDANYAASSSTTPAVITITPVAATLAATISPTGSVPYGYNATLNITATATSGSIGPAGTVTATVSGNNGTYTATLSATTGSLASTASISFPVPPPGTYTITIACSSSAVTCNTATVRLTTTKGFTTTTIGTLTPTSPQAGTPVTITATVANSGTGTGTYTYSGTVSFYTNGKFLASAPVSNGVATGTITFLSALAQSVTAVYSGDVNWNGSTSTPLSVLPTPLPAVIVLTANTLSGVVGQNITLTAALSSGVTTATLIPTGSITFYDTYNGVVVNLGSAALLSNGLSTSYAQLSTTGLRAGAHNIIAVYAGDSVFEKTTSSATIVNIGDFALTFLPTSLNVTAGSSATGTLVVASLNGFSGSIALGCTPPPGAAMTCSVSPQVVATGGTAQFTITTTKGTTASVVMPVAPRIAVAALLGGVLSLCFVRRRRVVALFLLLVLATMVSGGCTQVAGTSTDTIGSGSGGTPVTSTGTPLGTLNVTITAASVDSPVNARHTYLVPVTVQ